MTISVIDTAPSMRGILAAAPEDRADLVREMWSAVAGLYHFIPDGVDMAMVHRQSFGFDVHGTTEPIRQALDRLVKAKAWHRIKTAIESGLTALQVAAPEIQVPDLTVLLVLGNPTDKHFIDEIQGLSAFGGISGYITITIWPTPQVLERLEAIAVHELHHNVRYSPGGLLWDPMTVTVGEQVISEGLADVFATEMYGELGYTHFVSASTRTDDDVLLKVADGLHITGMQNFTAWIHGDASARQFGAAPVGLPTGAGYAAGTRLVRAYLDLTESTAAQCVATPAHEILRVAAPKLGLHLKNENWDQ
ncbi:DUF2268 domain-containing protein [Glutamicibacter sp. JC586]|uniref:DUF2268 domain-containing protein n=1 Tax=Glutamicibacter sp. JC586 TaxID=2590552 RepID=UPI00135830D0|nr:DUF2268 domain-containing putative Zn-dependent protease [Glutamicibacter sp. JC586]